METMLKKIMEDTFLPDVRIGVEFTGEDGVDAGALRSALFEIIKTGFGQLSHLYRTA